MTLQSEQDNICMTEAEYLSSELRSEVKREYFDGYIYAMTGASANHARIIGNVFSEFRNHLKGMPCESFMADMKVKAGKNYLYPDVVVDCGKIAGDEYFVISPVVIVEVLSKSTRKNDTTKKLLYYLNLPTLQEYVLMEQEFVSIQVLRKSKHWTPEYYYLGDQVTFESIGLTLSVEAIYDRVDNNDMDEFRQTKPIIS
ncbi:MAG: Uma2 family endonuclease [Methylococcales bacterium]